MGVTRRYRKAGRAIMIEASEVGERQVGHMGARSYMRSYWELQTGGATGHSDGS